MLGEPYYYAKKRDPSVNKHFAPEALEAFADWNRKVFAPGKLDKKTKGLVAVDCTYLTARAQKTRCFVDFSCARGYLLSQY
jgi:alkylhydroperoxidase/carboxymuconolactone decarboxylase family protein YurZ